MTNSQSNHSSVQESGGEPFVIRVHETLSELDGTAWNRLSGASRSGVVNYNPFISYGFLSALEDSGCASAQSGWLGQHLALEDSDGVVVAALPCYLKSHSQGEYVFDHGWADAFERAGGRYYPKLQASVPFTPVTGPRLLLSADLKAETARQALSEGLKTLTSRLGVSSAHVTFAEDADIESLTECGFLHRLDQQFHFENADYVDFDAFLETLSSRKRKNIRKERSAAVVNDITIEWLTGAQLTDEVMDAFFAFYTDTGSRKWGRPYLNRRFYSLIAARMAEDILLIMAKRDGRYVAGAINFIGGDRLYGRHWGCEEHHPYLHFEICYYQAIEFAIAHKLRFVEAGAQGEHKLARGYMPVNTHSAHYIPHDGFRRAIADYLRHERMDVDRFSKILAAHGPFKKSG